VFLIADGLSALAALAIAHRDELVVPGENVPS
jgi:hypothetical protein